MTTGPSLPDPLVKRTGWPWTFEGIAAPALPAGVATWPKISIVTPSYNQDAFIEETIRSILGQGYPNLEYIIMDGGSKDRSVEVIKYYEPYVTFWTSEKDRGQSHAVNKGVARCTGDLFNWINSDDLLMPGALHAVALAWLANPGRIVAGTVEYFNEKGVFDSIKARNINVRSFIRFWENEDFGWNQPGTFVPLQRLNAMGGLREDLRYCMDYNMMVELLRRGTEVSYVDHLISRFRFHTTSKTVGEARKFRLERVNMLRNLKDLPVPVQPWEWDHEQARRMIDLARRDLKVRNVRGAAQMLKDALRTSFSGSMAELREIAGRNLSKLWRTREAHS